MNAAIEKCKQLLAQFPDNELARFSLGKAYFDLEQFGEAREQFQLALDRKPEWMVVQILIGKCDLALGNRAAARIAFSRARQLALDQNHEGPLAEMDQALEQLAGEEPFA